MLLRDLDDFLRDYLEMDRFAGIDSSLNGLQVGRQDKSIERIAYSVDAALETIKRAVEMKVDLLLVHHGIFWGNPQAIVGQHFQRIKTLVQGDLGLYAVHLPLDAHSEVGNNAVMARHLGLTDLSPFGAYRGVPVGWRGRLDTPMNREEILRRLFGNQEEVLSLLPFGPEKIESVGIVSGGAPRMVTEAIQEGLDLFITGDASHTIYHEALEASINVLFGGHYATETWGVRRLGTLLAEKFNLTVEEIDLPTGL